MVESLKALGRIIFLLFPCTVCISQPALLPHIGLSGIPSGSDAICPLSVYSGEMDTSGIDLGSLVPDFTLYKTNGDSVRLSSVLAQGLPVLLVGGNYTCPIFRQKIPVLNDITNYYSGLLQIYLVYGPEAHPVNDPSPYSGVEWVTADNYSEGVLFEQPDTYSEKLLMIDSLLANYTIIPDLVVDGPCNEWWNTFGPAPNNAYLIDTNGYVQIKHGWFHRNAQNIWCDLDAYLGTNSGNCITAGNNGNFIFTLDADSIASGLPGDVLSIHGTIQNLSNIDNVIVNISKQTVTVPVDWSTALCGDICYPTTTTNATVTISPGDDLPFIFYFYSGVSPDSGTAKIRFRNVNNPTNTIFQRYKGITEAIVSVSEKERKKIDFYPNPVNDELIVELHDFIQGQRYFLYDNMGRIVRQGAFSGETLKVNLSQLIPGVYLMEVSGNHFRFIKQ